MAAQVIFCGLRYDNEKVLYCLDVFVLPSHTEGLSMALLEAMACGRALIVSDIAATDELLTPDQDALVVDPNDSEELNSAIDLLCKDEVLRMKLGHNAEMKVSQYDEDRVFPRILEYYETKSC
jgi:glycosyltransferase involved in cell wall biosynthesis